MNNIPDKVKIGAITYEVKFVENLDGENGDGTKTKLDGRIRYGDCDILINPANAPQRLRQTLWHEIIHGIFGNASIYDIEEQTIDLLAHGIVDVLISNPDLIRLMK